jgi:hypothetical protein
MKIVRLAPLLLFSLIGCSDSKQESQVKEFESKSNPDLALTIGKLQKTGTITGADSLNYLLKSNLTEVGINPSTIENWTPDSMIAHYKKITNSFRTSIDAFKYTASVAKEKGKTELYADFIERYTNDLKRDSLRLNTMERLTSMKDSTLALKYSGVLSIQSKDGSKQEVTKTYVFSTDGLKLLGVIKE